MSYCLEGGQVMWILIREKDGSTKFQACLMRRSQGSLGEMLLFKFVEVLIWSIISLVDQYSH